MGMDVVGKYFVRGRQLKIMKLWACYKHAG